MADGWSIREDGARKPFRAEYKDERSEFLAFSRGLQRNTSGAEGRTVAGAIGSDRSNGRRTRGEAWQLRLSRSRRRTTRTKCAQAAWLFSVFLRNLVWGLLAKGQMESFHLWQKAHDCSIRGGADDWLKVGRVEERSLSTPRGAPRRLGCRLHVRWLLKPGTALYYDVRAPGEVLLIDWLDVARR